MATHVTYAVLDSLFRLGKFRDVLQAIPDASHHPDARIRALIAHATAYAGSPETAASLATSCRNEREAGEVRARAEIVLGVLDKRAGNVKHTIERMQHATRLANNANDHGLAAWAHLHLFRLLAEGFEPEALGPAFREARRLVTHAADPHLTAFLHDCVSVKEARCGRLDEARRHLDIELSILQRHPNAWLEYMSHVNAGCISILGCDLKSAMTHLRIAREIGDAGGIKSGLPIIVANEAHVFLVSGQFLRAFDALSRLSTSGGVLTRVTALDGLARLYLALNRLDECERTICELTELTAQYQLDEFYVARWSNAVRARLLVRRSMWEAASEHCARQAYAAQDRGDMPLKAALTSTHSEALASLGDSIAAASKLLDSSETGAASIREHAGHFFEACSRLAATSNPLLSTALARRASRFWHRERNTCAYVESQSRGGPPLEIRNMVSSEYRLACGNEFTEELDARSMAVFITGAIGAALELSFDGELVRRELEAVAKAIGCDADLTFTSLEIRQQDVRDPRGGHAAEFHGSDCGSFRVSCTSPRNPINAIAVGDILRLIRSLSSIANARRHDRKRAALWPETDQRDGEGIFASEEMVTISETASKIARTNLPVLITGETGTGKEILARAIHAASTRANTTFLPFNCSVGPRDMIDAQLFGHRRGAFTGAVDHAPGVIRAAAGGTLFLDEIGESPLEVQPKLLRVLELGEIHPVGESHPVKVDVRIIAATNIDLDAAVSSGRFREDLFYRLNIVRLHLPPLRERRVEIPVFAQHYLRKHAREQHKGDLRLAEETMEYLLLYRWPGNVRQLANEMRRLAALAEPDAVLMPEHLSTDILASRRTVPASQRTLDPNEVVVRIDQPMAAATEHLERAMLQYALAASGGRMEETARRLGLSRKGLYLKRLRFGLEPPETHARTA